MEMFSKYGPAVEKEFELWMAYTKLFHVDEDDIEAVIEANPILKNLPDLDVFVNNRADKKLTFTNFVRV